jgi:hypothetical protein
VLSVPTTLIQVPRPNIKYGHHGNDPRPMCEEHHQGMKTGCQVEDAQVTDSDFEQAADRGTPSAQIAA